MQYSSDSLRVIRRELMRCHEALERIVGAASHNPACLVCAEVRKIAAEALRPLPPTDRWAL